MLRTLGMQEWTILQHISIRTFMYSVPGFIVGFMVMVLALSGIKMIIFAFVGFNAYTNVDWTTIFVVNDI